LSPDAGRVSRLNRTPRHAARKLFFRSDFVAAESTPEVGARVRAVLQTLCKFLIFIANSIDFATLLSLGSGIPMS
jgi:hypothetical protein